MNAAFWFICICAWVIAVYGGYRVIKLIGRA